MRSADLDPRQAAAGVTARATPRRLRVSVRFSAIALGGFALGGCEMLVPLPDAVLLKPLPSPRCEARPTAQAGKEAGAETAKLGRLDYEAQCYRHAEMIARHRLGKLQESLRQSAAKARKGDTAAAANP